MQSTPWSWERMYIHRYLPVPVHLVKSSDHSGWTVPVQHIYGLWHQVCIELNHLVQLSIVNAKLHSTIFLATSTIEEAQGLLDGWITPISSISAISF